MGNHITKLAAFVEASRPLIWVFAITSAFCGMFMASKGLPPVDSLILVAIGVGPCITAATNLLNAVFDIEIDKLSKPKRPLPTSRISKSSTLIATGFLYSAGLIIASVFGSWPFMLTLSGVVLSILYSVPSTRIKARGGFSNFAVALGYTTVCYLGGWGIFRGLQETPLLILVYVTIQVTGANAVKDFVDYEADREFRVSTLVTKYGVEKTMNFILLSFALVYLTIPLFFLIGALRIVYLPISLFIIWGLLILNSLKHDFSRKNREKMFLQAFCMSLLTEIGFAVAYILA